MKDKKSAKLNNQHQNGHSSPFKLTTLFDPEASWDKDQLGDVLHWIRQVMALATGLLWGAIPLIGGIWLFVHKRFPHGRLPFIMLILISNEIQAIIMIKEQLKGDAVYIEALGRNLREKLVAITTSRFLAISTGVVYGYYSMLLKIDEEEFGGHGTLLQEGLFASITLFLLAWILVYSLLYF